MSRRFLVFFIFFSFVIHVFFIAIAFRVSPPVKKQADKIINVEIKPSRDIPRSVAQIAPLQVLSEINHVPKAKPFREASVDLGEPGGANDAYLRKIRRKIESLWLYPPRALSERREGSAVIRFSINAGGALADSAVISSSGSVLLDEGALAGVRRSAPFDPLPADSQLSLLHITATFSYRLNP
jgi:periplasmic protein TonB